MNRNILIVFIIATIVSIMIIFTHQRGENKLVSPNSEVIKESAISSPTPAIPKTFNFDSSTDLQAELEKVNPQVLDTDFE